jgi:thioredoxin:protein disulfide reductase
MTDRPDRIRRLLVLAAAALASVDGLAAEAELLPAERAFALSVQGRDPQSVLVRFDIAEGYYLYRDKFRFSVTEVGAAPPALAPGQVKEDRFFGRVETYRERFEVTLALDRPQPGQTLTVVVDSQGCADRGVCYPAQRQTLAIPMPRPGEPARAAVEASPRRRSWFN